MQQDISTGTVIDKRYQIQKKIPDTTSNQCYLAEDTDQSNRLVVMSFPKMELQTLLGFTNSFDEVCERLIKARLSGLIKIFDHGVHESQPYAVLQYVTHETLANSLNSNKLKQKKPSVDGVLDWARPLAVTLDELHGKGFIHSNIRPSNIFLGQNRQILLGDFVTEFTIQQLGASKQAIASLDIGDYLAPEYIKSNYTESYDQYLLATIVYKALAARSHFHNPGSTEAYRRQVATKFPEPLLNHRPELVGASRILGKALERNPVKRFDSCREFVNQLGSGQVNPTFGDDSDKPVTVIKKVLDFDETAPVDPIITSIRSRRNQGRKKGLAWLGVLLVGVGASAYGINHFGGFGQVKDKLISTWSDLTQVADNSPVVIPVDMTTGLQQPVTANTSGQSGAIDSSTRTSNVSKADTPTTSVDAPAVVSTDSASRTDDTKGLVDESVAVLVDANDQGIDVPKAESSTSEVAASNQSPIDNNEVVVVETLESIVDQALTDGQEEFNSSEVITEQATETVVNPENDINDAVSLALREAQVDYMRETSPAGSEIEPVSASEVTDGLVVDETSKGTEDELVTEVVVSDADVVEPVPSPVVENSQSSEGVLTKAEFDALDLNAQIMVANKLADKQAAEAKQAEEAKKRAREAQNQASISVDTHVSAADKSFEQMQQERAKLQAIKAEKIARISSVTKDCTTNGKIHRQVEKGNLAYVKNCLSFGIDPNVSQGNQRSLLHLASSGGYLNMAKLLLAKGADVNAKAVDGKTPLDMANEKNQERLVKYLRSRGGVTTR
jgi:serine/threonine protein kinase